MEIHLCNIRKCYKFSPMNKISQIYPEMQNKLNLGEKRLLKEHDGQGNVVTAKNSLL